MSEHYSRPLSIILYGTGALGGLVLEAINAGRPTIEVIGAVDIDPDKIGKSLAELFAAGKPWSHIKVAGSLAECLAGLSRKPDVAYHMTESVPDDIEDQLSELLEAGLHVVSAAESMFHPGLRFAGFTSRLDALARSKGVSITGTGINPGFAFDSLPLMLARATNGVRRIDIARVIDVTGTGPGDIDHVGYGLWPADFDAKIASGRIVGHMGLPESIALLAERLGMVIDTVTERWETETADFPVDSGDRTLGVLEPGRVVGITQFAEALRGDEVVMSMRLVMYYQPEKFGLEVSDRIEIDGAHRISASLVPAALSLFGAANIIVNATHDVTAAAPGFVNALDFSIGGPNRGGFAYALDDARPLQPGYVPLKSVPL
jgi:4-hydroxy-tetrahydrodipicolinate reductase